MEHKTQPEPEFRIRIREALNQRNERCREWIDKIKEWILTDVQKGHLARTYSFSYLQYTSDVELIAKDLLRYGDFFRIAHRDKILTILMNERILVKPIDEWSAQLVDAYNKVIEVNVLQITNQIISNIKNGHLRFTVELTSLHYQSFINNIYVHFAFKSNPGFVKMSPIETEAFLEFDIEKF